MLYFVATPIGNLKDVSLRALEVLNAADIIACEDTRHSLKFLTAHGIKKPLVSYHKFNEREACEKIVALLKENKTVALITDAGTPMISDPGGVLVNALIENGLEFTVIPGACAFVNALVLSGMDCSKFTFLGFLPQKNTDRKEFLEKYKTLDTTLIFYSAPHDLKKDLATLYQAFGDRRAVTVREITKIHETVDRFSLSESFDGEPRGEYVVLVSGAENKNRLLELSEKEHIEFYINSGMDKKDALKKTAAERGVSKSTLYKYTI